jgi:hypothetical protein
VVPLRQRSSFAFGSRPLPPSILPQPPVPRKPPVDERYADARPRSVRARRGPAADRFAGLVKAMTGGAPASRRRVRTRSAKALKPYVAQVRSKALRAFADEHPGLRVAPVVVVIAAYNEDESLGAVLEGIPSKPCGLDVDTVVVDDGSADRTSEIALAHRVLVARLERNCGHGIALRVGYQLAREHGARFIVTLDGDGQWDPADVPTVLQPLLSGEADFVIGSRVLGRSENRDLLRQAGVHVFAALVRLMTGVVVTDTSSGLRAMRAEVTASVRQEQVQYQTAELLIGAIYAGYRVVERPVVMHERIAGESKKGLDLVYGFRYARVILTTWWRARRARERVARVGEPGVE